MSRQFSEKDAAEILKAAAKLQQESALGSNPSGVSVDDLKKIAEESGIDPGFVDQALLSQAAQTKTPGSKGKLEILLEGELDGDRLDVIQESLSTLKGHKMLTQVGRTVQGLVTAPWCHLRVEAFSRNGRTRIQINPAYGMTFMMTGYAPSLIGVLATVFGFVFSGPILGFSLGITFSTIALLVTILGMRKADESARKVFDQMVADVQEELKRNPQPQPALQVNTPGPESSVGLEERLEQRPG